MDILSLYNPSKTINLIVKVVGNSCNIDCSYCFEKTKSVDNQQFKVKKLEDLLRCVQETCTVTLHGGEPLLLSIHSFDELLQILELYYPKKVTSIRIQTNGTLLTESWIDLLFYKYKKLNIEIAISLDGTKEMNALRTDYKKKNTFQQVLSSFKMLQKHNIHAGMLSVISKKSLTHAQEYIQLISSIPNLSFVKVNGLFNVENNNLTKDSITQTEYSNFILDVAYYYIQSNLYKKLPIEPILSIMQRLFNKPSRYCNYTSNKCYNFISFYPDGSLSPCDCLSLNNFPINSNQNETLEEIIKNELLNGNANQLQNLLSHCNSCNIKKFCMGGCLSQRLYFSENEELSKDFCNAKYMLYTGFQKMLKLKVV